MSIVVPKGRKYLCADALFRLLREHFATIADDRVDEVEIPLSDALMSAFAMFSLKAPSLLAFDKQRAEGNLKTIYGITHTPCDTRMREHLDPVSPESLRPSFTLVFRQLQRGKALEPMAFLDGHYLLALDGTGYLSSQTIHCAACLHKVHRNGSITYYERHDRAAGIEHQFRFVNDMPLHASRADVRVNFIEYWEIGPDQVQHFSWVTDLRVNKRNVSTLMRGGRARWKIENETFNTLKNQGYNFEHNYGHGEQHLSVVFATIMLLAFLVDQTQQLCCALFRAVWAKLGSKRLLWERLRALFYDYRLESMRELFEALFYGYETHRPILITDSSSIPPVSLTSLLVNPAIPTRHRRRLPRSRHVPIFNLTSCPFASPFDWRQVIDSDFSVS